MIILNISTNAMSLKGLEVWKTEILEGNCSANIKIIFFCQNPCKRNIPP